MNWSRLQEITIDARWAPVVEEDVNRKPVAGSPQRKVCAGSYQGDIIMANLPSDDEDAFAMEFPVELLDVFSQGVQIIFSNCLKCRFESILPMSAAEEGVAG